MQAAKHPLGIFEESWCCLQAEKARAACRMGMQWMSGASVTAS